MKNWCVDVSSAPELPLWSTTVLFLLHTFPWTAREAELRQLRKTNMEYEERNAALQKHVESMRGAVERLEGDVMQERGRNGLLHQHLETLRQALSSSFSTIPLPGESTQHYSVDPAFTKVSNKDRVNKALFPLVPTWAESPRIDLDRLVFPHNPVVPCLHACCHSSVIKMWHEHYNKGGRRTEYIPSI